MTGSSGGRGPGLYDDLSSALSDIFGSNSSVVSRRGLSGGSINRVERITIASGHELCVKVGSDRSDGAMFREEARGLLALHGVDGPRIPEVLAAGNEGGEAFLLLEYLRPVSKSTGFSRSLGSSLADMHRNGRSDTAGFHRDNYIGATPQENGPMERWSDFFGERRLRFQIRLAFDCGRADKSLVKGTENLIRRLSEILPEPEAGRFHLLHGDLWGGNCIVGPRGEPVLIDPAVYYGHREADLAMMQLFGGFSRDVFRVYEEEWPLERGFTERVDIYNLYHLLNHLNLFGGGYLGSCRSVARRFL